ncbi:hypothetical protein HID58_060997, partial [Brassica napus]
DTERLARIERVKQGIAETLENSSARLPKITQNLDKGKGHVFDFSEPSGKRLQLSGRDHVELPLNMERLDNETESASSSAPSHTFSAPALVATGFHFGPSSEGRVTRNQSTVKSQRRRPPSWKRKTQAKQDNGASVSSANPSAVSSQAMKRKSACPLLSEGFEDLVRRSWEGDGDNQSNTMDRISRCRRKIMESPRYRQDAVVDLTLRVGDLLSDDSNAWDIRKLREGKNLGKGKFLFNFTTEEDLMSVLQKGSFHYNYCMFVLVRWEPVVHDDYPWIIPFWVQLYGLPLHLWTVTNLKNIGSRIGHVDVDSIELTEGRMRIEVDSRRPLKFKRKVESPDAEEVTIDIKYDMLFKHCTTCGLMSHEKGYCPTMEPPARVSSERGGVFTRVQIPQVRNTRQPSLNEYNQLSLQRDAEPARNGAENREMASRWSAPRNQTMVRGRYQDDHAYQNRNTGAGDRFRSHSDRIIRRRDERHSGNRYGGSRYQRGPYDRKEELTWREKKMDMPLLKDKNTAYAQGGSSPKVDDVPYEQLHSNQQGRVRTERSQDEMEVEATGGKMRLASTIVTPSHQLTPQEDNVTIRGKNILDTNDAGMMECDVQDDDLLADEVREMDEKARHSHVAVSSNVMLAQRNKKSSRSGAKRSAPLGIQSREREILHQGSPRPRTAKSSGGSKIRGR